MNRHLETAATLALVAILFDALGFLFGLLFLPLIILPLIFMILNYVMVYARIKEGKPRTAQDPSLVLGIVELIFGGIVPGILLIICYVKINDGLSAESGKTMVQM